MKTLGRIRLAIACAAAGAAVFAIQQAAVSSGRDNLSSASRQFSYLAAQPYPAAQSSPLANTGANRGTNPAAKSGGFGDPRATLPGALSSSKSGSSQLGRGQTGLRQMAQSESGDGYLDDSINATQAERYGRGGEGAPNDAGAKTEWVFGRLMYGNLGDIGPPVQHRRLRRWSEDYPYADWVFAKGVQRLTRIDARGADEVVDAASDNIFNYPWIYANQVGNWSLPDDQAKRLREYLLRGGFLLADNFHGSAAWENFMAGIRKIFPDRPVEDLNTSDEIYHTLYDIDERIQVPGAEYEETGKTYVTYVPDAQQPHWRAIRDDRGRIVVAICHNMHLGDSWEHADDPRYPEHFTSFAYRVGIDYLVYAMTH